MSEELSPANVTEALLERVPAFAEARTNDESFISHGDDSPYLVFGDLERYLIELIRRGSNTPGDAETVNQIFALLNEMGNSFDPDVVNIISTTAFEALAGLPEGVVAARSNLTGKAADEFERIASWFIPNR